MTEWHDIASAPKGPVIMLWDGRTVSFASWQIISLDSTTGWWRYRAGPDEAEFSDYATSPICENPTHWANVPSGPIATETDE